MITFSRYEVRTEPGSIPFLIYASNWKEAEKSKEYRDFLAEQNPRSIQIIEQKYRYSGVMEKPIEPLEKIAQLKDSDSLEDAGTAIYYQYFGNKEIKLILLAKVFDEYEKKMSEVEQLHDQDMESFYEKLKDICAVETVFDNLVLRGDWYTPEYIEKLAELEEPLKKIAETYAELTEFDIQKDVRYSLAEARAEIIFGTYEHIRNSKAYEGQSEEERLGVLKEAIEKEYAEYKAEWDAMSFEEKVDACMYIFTVRQFYKDLKEHMSEYSPTSVYCLGAFEKPLSYDIESVTAMRIARAQNEKVLADTFAKLFPDTEIEVDKWEIWDIRQKAGFILKEGKELRYRELENLNTQDSYGHGIFEYLKRWAGSMEQEMEGGMSVSEVALSTSSRADTDGITGAMYGCAVAVLSEYWEYGEQLREWHNNRYSYSGQGVVNPASFILEPKGAEETENNSPQLSM